MGLGQTRIATDGEVEFVGYAPDKHGQPAGIMDSGTRRLMFASELLQTE